MLIVQEELEHKTYAMSVNATKMTGKLFLKMLKEFVANCENPKLYKGKQTVKQLNRYGDGLKNVEINDDNIKSFERFAKKYGVDFALKKIVDFEKNEDGTLSKNTKHIVFFKGRDEETILQAMKDYVTHKVTEKEKPSIIEALHKAKDKADITKEVVEKVKEKTQGAIER